MGKYKVEYSGFMYVEAENIEEAIEKAIDQDTIYEETYRYDAFEVDDFEVII